MGTSGISMGTCQTERAPTDNVSLPCPSRLHVRVLYCLPQCLSHPRIELWIVLFPSLAIWKYQPPQLIHPRNQWLVIRRKLLTRHLEEVTLVTYHSLFYFSQFLCISIVPFLESRNYSAFPSRPSVIYANLEENPKKGF
jgi:hypothetical protein